MYGDFTNSPKVALWVWNIPESSSLMEDLQMTKKVQFFEIQRLFETFQMAGNQNWSTKILGIYKCLRTCHHITFMNFPY